MNADLSAVAVAAPTTTVSANVLQMARFFARGVPADDATCVRMMREVQKCRGGPSGDLTFRISEKFSVVLVVMPGYVVQDLKMDHESDLECDAYGEKDEALVAEFHENAGSSGHRRLDTLRALATPDGCRQFVRDVRAVARTLREKGLCPKCTDQAMASMRLPHASYCGKCCWEVALLGDEQ